MAQHICFGAMCDIKANSYINMTKGTFTQNTDYMDILCHMSYRTYRLCPFVTFLALATNYHIWLLIVWLIINIFPFFSD